ncbi:TRIM3 [Branchiostoma lanceolatum]|uniref:RING-type E3 ubiquitin transferase n=1 Tax=Branchiostoma lanceolatum TaxID=7740 RepID=A0A8J9ZBX2_BRALA|nr:TRIM3 [Branchiostoma lanceolatum]
MYNCTIRVQTRYHMDFDLGSPWETTVMAAAPSSLGTQFSEELTCSICLELFTRPKVLPCGHTFCQHCLQDHAGRKVPFQCPNCRQQVRPPRQGVAGLPDSHIIANLCERLQTQATLSEEIREQPQSKNRCSFHPSEEVKLYCKQCKVPVCHECFEESHDEHPTMSFKKAIQQQRAPIQALIAEGRDILETYHSFIRGLRDDEKILDDRKQETDTKIEESYKQACDQVIQKLTEERGRLLSEVEANHRQNKGAVQSQRDAVLTDVAELSSACDGAEQHMVRECRQLLSRESKLVETVGTFRGKVVPSPVQTHPAVFQPNVSVKLECALGDVTVPGAATASDHHGNQASDAVTTVMGHHHGYQASDAVMKVMGHHHGNQSNTAAPKQRLTFGGVGSQPGQFTGPFGVTVSEEGEIFVADRWNKRIQVFTLQGTFVSQFPTDMSGGQKMKPDDIAIDWEGNLWVVGESNSARFAVQYDKQGRMLRKFAKRYKMRWRGVAVDTRNNHIVFSLSTGVSPLNNTQGEVQVVRPDGTLVRTVGQQQGMKDIGGITVDEEGNILVSDHGNHCVYVFNVDGQFLFQFGGERSGEGQLKRPRGICTDKAGNIIVAETAYDHSRVKMFDKTGRFLKHITTDMENPWAVAMAPQGQLVITDSDNHKVTIFSKIVFRFTRSDD